MKFKMLFFFIVAVLTTLIIFSLHSYGECVDELCDCDPSEDERSCELYKEACLTLCKSRHL